MSKPSKTRQLADALADVALLRARLESAELTNEALREQLAGMTKLSLADGEKIKELTAQVNFWAQR